ncbi:MAG: hypothetical protein U1E46_17690 [Hyphomicrobiales bacterium]
MEHHVDRARPIWIVTSGDQVVAAFTVRRQLVTFLSEDAKRYGEDLAIVRVPDGKACHKAFFEAADLIPTARRRRRPDLAPAGDDTLIA